MSRHKIKWKFFSLFILLVPYAQVNCLPVTDVFETPLVVDELIISEEEFLTSHSDFNNEQTEDFIGAESETATEVIKVINDNVDVVNETFIASPIDFNFNASSLMRSDPVRPGQTVRDYQVDITVSGGSFSGIAIIQVQLEAASRDDDIRFHVEDLNIQSVSYGIVTLSNPTAANFWVDEGVLSIEAPVSATSYIFLVSYTGTLSNNGYGLYQGSFNANDYIAMNLHPTNARRVFPCMDEPTQETTITLTFHNLGHTQIVSNSIATSSDATSVQFAALQGPPHRWGLLAHSFVNVNNPFIGARLYVRPGLSNQDAQASIIINAVFTRLEEWTRKPLAEVQQNQNEVINIVALPDVTRDWYGLSNVPIWEPYILMSTNHAVAQRKTALIKISESLARQWFGYVIYPENWRHQWIINGLVTHAAYEAVRSGQALESDNTVIDTTTMFVTDVLQESLYRDGYSTSKPIQLDSDLFNENDIRAHMNGLLQYKGPVIMSMLKSVLGQTNADSSIDYLQTAARNLLVSRSMQTFNDLNFYDAINSEWMGASNKLIDDIDEFVTPWITNPNYPVVNVQGRSAGVIITQERFSFVSVNQVAFQVPISYTTSINPNFEDTRPTMILDNNLIIDLFLNEEDWFLANIQGQGYYRVNYDIDLWERIINALENPETREIIHPLNRAALLDDSLNLARAGKLDYDVAFRIAMSMQHETHYAVWRAFIRNMDFIKKRLMALVLDDEDRDPNIYLRVIRRVITAVEDQLGFYPDVFLIEDSMLTLTRGIVMEHACLADYAPCVAAAIDWFIDPNSSELAVNPNIPPDIRPAVYCSMMRNGGNDARDALWTLLDSETSTYERLAIAKAMGCITDENYLIGLLQEGLAGTDRFTIQERNYFFHSLIESDVRNAEFALRFIRANSDGVRRMYGGSENLEAIINKIADNCNDFNMADTMDIWVNSINSNLDDSYDSALAATERVQEDLIWLNVHLETVYEWLDENDAHTVTVSLALLLACYFVTVFTL